MYIVTHVKQQVSRLWSRVSDFTREVNNELIRARISCFIKQHDQLKKLNLNQSTLFQKNDLNASYIIIEFMMSRWILTRKVLYYFLMFPGAEAVS